MDILEPCIGMMTNYEVYQLIQDKYDGDEALLSTEEYKKQYKIAKRKSDFFTWWHRHVDTVFAESWFEWRCPVIGVGWFLSSFSRPFIRSFMCIPYVSCPCVCILSPLFTGNIFQNSAHDTHKLITIILTLFPYPFVLYRGARFEKECQVNPE